MALPERIRERLTLPAVAAPMFLCSGVSLAAEVCKASLIGSLTRNHCRDIEEFEVQLASVADHLARFRDAHPESKVGPLAVNISPGLSREEVRAHTALCRRHGADIVITAAGDPTPIAPLVRDAGLLHYHDTTSMRFAEKAIKAGVDGLIAIGAGGGGHSGNISHLVLIPKLRRIFDGTLVLAGTVSTGSAIRAAEVLGADLCYLGTRFIATRESMAPDAYKAMIVTESETGLVYTDAVSGVPANWLKASLRSAGLDPDALPRRAGADTDHLSREAKPWKTLWSAGQGVGLIDDVPSVSDLVRRLQAEYVAASETPTFAEAARAALQRFQNARDKHACGSTGSSSS
jgi:nitronate monooxygenase